jgi:hypothetical protein
VCPRAHLVEGEAGEREKQAAKHLQRLMGLVRSGVKLKDSMRTRAQGAMEPVEETLQRSAASASLDVWA